MRKKIFFSLLIGIFCLSLIFLIASDVKAKTPCPIEFCISREECEEQGGTVDNQFACESGLCCFPQNGNGNGNGNDNGNGGFISISIQNPLATTTFEAIIDNIIDFIFNIAIVLAPLMTIVAGFLFVTAGGNLEQINRAKAMITWSIIGFLIILLAKGIMTVIENLLGIS